MTTFRVEGEDFLIRDAVLAKIPMLNGMKDLPGELVVYNCAKEEMKAVLDCLQEEKIPSIEHREVFNFLSIESEDSYAHAA